MILEPPSPGSGLFDRWGFLFLPAAIALLLVWMPFGFSITGLIEEWQVLSVFTGYGDALFWVGADGPMPHHRLRPLTILPHAVAFALDPDSFFYWHVLLYCGLLLKSIAAALLGWWLTHSRRWSVVLALLVLFHPADTMQFSFRAFHINWSVAMALMGLVACAYAQTLVAGWQRAVATALALLFAVTASLTYEAALLFVPGVYLLLYARFGIRGAWQLVKTRPIVNALWILAAAANAVYILYVLKVGGTYQQALVPSEAQIHLNDRLERVVSIGYGRSLFGGWLDAIDMLRFEYRNYTYLVVAGVIGFAAACFAVRASRAAAPSVEVSASAASLPRIALAGLVLILLGYLPFVVSFHHLSVSQRTFLGAIPGASLVTLTVLIALSRRANGFGIILSLASVLLGFAATLFQFDHYRRISNMQHAVLGDIVEHMPPPAPGRTLMIIDERNAFNGDWMLLANVQASLNYLYATQLTNVTVCQPYNEAWFQTNAEGTLGTCEENEEGWKLRPAPLSTGASTGEAISVSRDSADVVRLKFDGSTETSEAADFIDNQRLIDHQRLLVSGEDAVSRRYRNILRPSTWIFQNTMFRNTEGGSDFNWSFGRWWSMDLPVHGGGWVPAGWTYSAAYLPVWKSYNWASAPHTSLQFDLSPSLATYELKVAAPALGGGVSPSDLKISLNGHVLDAEWIDGFGYAASVPSNLLVRGQNQLEFESSVPRERGHLLILVDWISLSPQR